MEENIFISWSKPRAQELAVAVKKFVPRVIQAAKPWVSKGGVEKGQRWNQEIAGRLASIQVGIVCLTPENLSERWIMFESGALAKHLGEDTRLCPYVLDIDHTDVGLPLSQFQVTKAEKDDTLELMRALNSVLGETLEDDQLEDTFEKFWPELDSEIQRIRAMSHEPAPPKRETNEILDEVLKRLQAIESQVGGIPEWPALLKWKDVLPYLQALATRAVTEISRNNAAVEALKKITEDPGKPENEKMTSYQSLYNTQRALNELQRLQAAIVEFIRAKEETGRYFNL